MQNTRDSSQILIKFEFSSRVFGKHSNIKFGTKFFHAEGQAGKTKLIVDFGKFAKVPKMIFLCPIRT